MTQVTFAIAVRDESKVIERCMVAAHKAVPHAQFFIYDTGSTDDTVKIIEATAKALGATVTIERQKWLGFGETWSRLLRRARSLAARKGYIWLLDADETIESLVDLPNPTPLVTGYSVTRLEGDGDWENPGIRIFNAKYEWSYRGERHAAPFCRSANGSVKTLPIDVRNHRDGARGTAMDGDAQKQRFLADFEHFSKESIRSGSTRATYYAAQSAQDAGENDLARIWYLKRASQTGNIDERYISMMRSGQAGSAWELDQDRLCAPMYLADKALACGEMDDAKRWTVWALASEARVGFLTQRSHRWRRWVMAAQLEIVSPQLAIKQAERFGLPDYARFALELLEKNAAVNSTAHLPPGYRHAVEAFAGLVEEARNKVSQDDDPL